MGHIKFLTVLFFFHFSILSAQSWVRSIPLPYEPSEVRLYETPGGNFLLHPNNGYPSGRKETLIKVDAFGNLIAIDDSTTQQYICREIILTPLEGENIMMTGNWGITTLKVKLDPNLHHTYIPNQCQFGGLYSFQVQPDLKVISGKIENCSSCGPHTSIQTLLLKDTACNIIWSASDTTSYTLPANTYYSQSMFTSGFTRDSNIIAVFGRFMHEQNTVRLHDYLLLKTDRNGNILWKKWTTVPLNLFIGPVGIRLFTSPKTDHAYPVIGNKITAYNEAGAELWTKDLVYNNLTATSDGNLIGCRSQNNDLLIAKLTPDLDTIWTKKFGAANYFEKAINVMETSDKGLLIAGSRNINQQYALYLVRTDSLGNAVQPQLTGQCYKDLNLNCQRDTGELPFTDLLLHTKGTPAYYQNPDANGEYLFDLPSGIVPVVVKPNSPLYKPCNDTIYANLDGALKDTIDIPVQVAISCPAVQVYIQHSLLRRCFEGILYVTWKNNGTAEANPVIQVSVDDALQILSTSIPPSSQNGNLLEFSPGVLPPDAFGGVQIVYKVDCHAFLGSEVCSSVYTQPDSACMSYFQTPIWEDVNCGTVIGSFDPNDKTATPEGYGAPHFIQRTQPIDYLIRFQNTGNDTAFTVVVRDTLSPWLDPATFQMNIASHPVMYNISGRGLLKFTFPNILLPDSNINEVRSHGFVRYSILPHTDVPTDARIENRAGIYFDFNDPVITNTVHHTIDRFWYTNQRDTAVCTGKKFLGLTITQDTTLTDTVTYTDNYLILNYDVHALPVYHAAYDTTAYFGDTIFNQVIHNTSQQIVLHYTTSGGCDSTIIWHVNGLTGTGSPAYLKVLKISPNPADDHLFIDASAFAGETLLVSLWSPSGQLFGKEEKYRGGSVIHLPLGELPDGCYLLKTAVPGKGIEVRRFIIMKY